MLMLISWKGETEVPASQSVLRIGLRNQEFTGLLLVIASVTPDGRSQGGGPMTL